MKIIMFLILFLINMNYNIARANYDDALQFKHYEAVQKTLESGAEICIYKLGFEPKVFIPFTPKALQEFRTETSKKIKKAINESNLSIYEVEELIRTLVGPLHKLELNHSQSELEDSIITNVLETEVSENDEAFVESQRKKYVDSGMKFYRQHNTICNKLAKNKFGALYFYRRPIWYDYDQNMPYYLGEKFDTNIYDDLF